MRTWHSTWELYLMLCGVLNGKEVQMEGTNVYVRLFHSAVQQELTQHCKATVCAPLFSHDQLFMTSQTVEPTRLLCPWNFPCKNIGVGCHFLLQQSNYTHIKKIN